MTSKGSNAPVFDWNPLIDEHYPAFADLVRRYVKTHRDRCRGLARTSHRWFRATGVAVILFGAALPVLTVIRFAGEQAVVTILALALALLSGLRTFYQWDLSWRLYRQQDLAITVHLVRWETEMLDAIGRGPSEGTEHAKAVTVRTLDGLREAGMAEFESFFANVTWPTLAQQVQVPTAPPGAL